MTNLDRLNRFVVAHGSCGDEFTFIELDGHDVVEDAAGLSAWLAVRCDACGTSTRQLVLLKEMFGRFAKLVADAGVDVERFMTALQHGDEKTADVLSKQVERSPAMLRFALELIRNGQAQEIQN